MCKLIIILYKAEANTGNQNTGLHADLHFIVHNQQQIVGRNNFSFSIMNQRQAKGGSVLKLHGDGHSYFRPISRGSQLEHYWPSKSVVSLKISADFKLWQQHTAEHILSHFYQIFQPNPGIEIVLLADPNIRRRNLCPGFWWDFKRVHILTDRHPKSFEIYFISKLHKVFPPLFTLCLCSRSKFLDGFSLVSLSYLPHCKIFEVIWVSRSLLGRAPQPTSTQIFPIVLLSCSKLPITLRATRDRNRHDRLSDRPACDPWSAG